MPSGKKLADQANAVHEAGHTVSIWTEPRFFGVKRVTIAYDPSTGNAGTTYPRHKKWMRALMSREIVQARIRTFLAGRIAEELCLGQPFMGAYDDFESATAHAMLLVSREGMHGKVGVSALGELAGSEHAKKLVDKAVAEVLAACFLEEKKRLAKHKQAILKVAFALMEKRTLKKRDLKKLLGKRPAWQPPMGVLKPRKNAKARRK